MIQNYLSHLRVFCAFALILLPINSVAETGELSEQERVDLQAQQIICLNAIPPEGLINQATSSDEVNKGLRNIYLDCMSDPSGTLKEYYETGSLDRFLDDNRDRPTMFVYQFGDESPFGNSPFDNNGGAGNGDGGDDPDCHCSPPKIEPLKKALKEAEDALKAAQKALDDATTAYSNSRLHEFHPDKLDLLLKLAEAQVARDEAGFAKVIAQHNVDIAQAQIDACEGKKNE